MPRKTIALFLLFILAVGMGASMVGAQIPVPPHRVFGYVTYADGTPAVNVTVNFVLDNGDVWASDLTGSDGYYDTEFPPGLENDIPEPDDKTLDIYVGDWKSDNVLHWETAGSDKIDISGVPVPVVASVSTDPATNVTTDSATLNSSIDYGDYSSVDITFFYRKIGATLENTGLETISAASYSKEVTDLDSDSDYEFYAYIEFDGKENTGLTKEFTTLKAELTVSTEGATNVTTDSATLNMSYDFKDYDSGDVRFSWRKIGGSWNSTTWVGKSGSGSYSEGISGLSSGTNYEFYAQVRFDTQTKDGATLTFTTATPVNQPPTAAFTYSPTEPNPDEIVSFDASASSDPDGTIVSYDWSFGDEAMGTGETTTHSYSETGDYTVTLTVTDDDGAINSTSKTVTVVSPPPVNQPPTADADGPYSVDEGETVELDGTGSSDPDGDALTYSWAITNDPTGEASLTDADTSTPTFHAPSVDSDTEVTVELTVDDGHGHTDSDTATVTVKAVAPPAEFEVSDLSISPEEVEPGEAVTVSAKVTNIGGQSGSYEVEFYVDGVLEDTKTVTLSPDGSTTVTFTTSREDEGTYGVEVDGQIGSFEVKKPEVFPWPVVVAVIIIVIVIVAIWCWKSEQISRRLRRVLKKE